MSRLYSTGSAPTSGSTLANLAAIKKTSAELDSTKHQLAEVEQQLRDVSPKAKKHKQLTHQLDIRVRTKQTVTGCSEATSCSIQSTASAAYSIFLCS